MVELSAIKKTRRLKTIKAAKTRIFHIRCTDLHQPELNSNRGDLSRPQRQFRHVLFQLNPGQGFNPSPPPPHCTGLRVRQRVNSN